MHPGVFVAEQQAQAWIWGLGSKLPEESIGPPLC